MVFLFLEEERDPIESKEKEGEDKGDDVSGLSHSRKEKTGEAQDGKKEEEGDKDTVEDCKEVPVVASVDKKEKKAEDEEEAEKKDLEKGGQGKDAQEKVLAGALKHPDLGEDPIPAFRGGEKGKEQRREDKKEDVRSIFQELSHFSFLSGDAKNSSRFCKISCALFSGTTWSSSFTLTPLRESTVG